MQMEDLPLMGSRRAIEDRLGGEAPAVLATLGTPQVVNNGQLPVLLKEPDRKQDSET
jgi:hypothetical protein